MDDLNEKIEDIVEVVTEVWLGIITILLTIGFLVTSPVWFLPYLIIKKIKEAKE